MKTYPVKVLVQLCRLLMLNKGIKALTWVW